MRLLAVAALAVTLLLGAALLPAPASAMCAYNRTGEQIAQFWFKCGWACWNQWDYVPNGAHRCRPSKSGKLTVTIATYTNAPDCTVSVDKHGWATVTSKNMGAIEQYTVTSKHSDGSVKSRCYIDMD